MYTAVSLYRSPVRDVLLLLLGGPLTLVGGYLSDLRADRRESKRVALERTERIREKQRDAVSDVLAVSARFMRTASVVGLSVLANHRKRTDFTDQSIVDEHGTHGRELDRAVAVARLLVADAPKTREALDLVELPERTSRRRGARR